MVTQTDLELADGRTLHAYDTGTDNAAGRLAVFWHHGSLNVGAPPEPLFPAAEELGIRWVSYDRPGYGGSTPHPDRDVATAASYASAVADALGIDRFAVMGYSHGGSHALGCAALLPERVLGVVNVAGTAPFGAEATRATSSSTSCTTSSSNRAPGWVRSGSTSRPRTPWPVR